VTLEVTLGGYMLQDITLRRHIQNGGEMLLILVRLHLVRSQKIFAAVITSRIEVINADYAFK
jgi:hypothetical protein